MDTSRLVLQASTSASDEDSTLTEDSVDIIILNQDLIRTSPARPEQSVTYKEHGTNDKYWVPGQDESHKRAHSLFDTRKCGKPFQNRRILNVPRRSLAVPSEGPIFTVKSGRASFDGASDCQPPKRGSLPRSRVDSNNVIAASVSRTGRRLSVGARKQDSEGFIDEPTYEETSKWLLDLDTDVYEIILVPAVYLGSAHSSRKVGDKKTHTAKSSNVPTFCAQRLRYNAGAPILKTFSPEQTRSAKIQRKIGSKQPHTAIAKIPEIVFNGAAAPDRSNSSPYAYSFRGAPVRRSSARPGANNDGTEYGFYTDWVKPKGASKRERQKLVPAFTTRPDGSYAEIGDVSPDPRTETDGKKVKLSQGSCNQDEDIRPDEVVYNDGFRYKVNSGEIRGVSSEPDKMDVMFTDPSYAMIRKRYTGLRIRLPSKSSRQSAITDTSTTEYSLPPAVPAIKYSDYWKQRPAS